MDDTLWLLEPHPWPRPQLSVRAEPPPTRHPAFRPHNVLDSEWEAYKAANSPCPRSWDAWNRLHRGDYAR